MAEEWKPNFNISNPYSGMPPSYAALVASVYVPTAEQPLNPVQRAAAAGQLPSLYLGTDLPDYSGILGAIEEFIENLRILIYQWFHDVVDWIHDKLKPLFDTIWEWISTEVGKVAGWIATEVTKVFDWIQAAQQWIVTSVTAGFVTIQGWVTIEVAKVWGWLKSEVAYLWANIQTGLASLEKGIRDISATVATKVREINEWFSNEFIDPFIDWLVQLPGKLWEPFDERIAAIGRKLESWLTRKSPGFLAIIASWWNLFWEWARTRNAKLQQWLQDHFAFKPGDPMALVTLATAAIGGAFAESLPLIGEGATGFWRWILTVLPRIGGWFTKILSSIWGWITAAGTGIGAALASTLARVGGWFASQWVPLLGSSAILGLEATGKLQGIIEKFVSPAVDNVLTWAEGMGPVAPQSGADTIRGVTRLATFTVSGLAAMTLAGEALSPLKHIGLGHISAVLYDLINYKTLTAAFMGVLAFVYIKTPLTYYYNKIARPNLPDERTLINLAGEYAISKAEFVEYMQFQGYTDTWIEKIYELADRPLTPFMFRNLAEAGLLDEELLEREIRNAGYNEKTIPYLKQMMRNLAASALAAVSTSTAMTRYQEGFDDEATLRRNLSVLGIADAMLGRYVFAGQLKYLYDYQSDLKAYYTDLYHRREIEEPELRTSLAQIGLATERLDLVVNQQKIKRVAAPRPVEDPALAIQLDTIRDRRKKLLTTREEEITQLVAIGKELPYSIAIADNDDVALAEKAVPPKVVAVPFYETEEGKVRVDTVRRLRRQRQITPEEEQSSLEALQMSHSMAAAVVANDALRLKRETEAET